MVGPAPSTPTRSACWWRSAPGCCRSCLHASCRWCPAYLSMVSGLSAAELTPPSCARSAGRRAGARVGASGGPGSPFGSTPAEPWPPRRRRPPPGPSPPRRVPAGQLRRARPAAPGDPRLHRRLHRHLHHPRGVGLGHRAAVPHPPALLETVSGILIVAVRRALGGHGRRVALPRPFPGRRASRAPLRARCLGPPDHGHGLRLRLDAVHRTRAGQRAGPGGRDRVDRPPAGSPSCWPTRSGSESRSSSPDWPSAG